MKSVDDIKKEIDKSISNKKNILVEIVKYPVLLDYLVKDKNSPIFVDKDSVTIKHGKGMGI